MISLLKNPSMNTMSSLRIQLLVALLFLQLAGLDASAHPGGLDASCGHNDRSAGKYHYHQENCTPGKMQYEKLSGKVVRVKDGDTVIVAPVDSGRKSFTCRLYGIDAPETPKRGKRGQAYGKQAADELYKLVFGYPVDVTLTGDKTYNREVCIIRKDGSDINLEMVKRGYSWAYREYLSGPYASEYIGAEKEAREKGLGLWIQRNPMPPWEFRKR